MSDEKGRDKDGSPTLPLKFSSSLGNQQAPNDIREQQLLDLKQEIDSVAGDIKVEKGKLEKLRREKRQASADDKADFQEEIDELKQSIADLKAEKNKLLEQRDRLTQSLLGNTDLVREFELKLALKESQKNVELERERNNRLQLEIKYRNEISTRVISSTEKALANSKNILFEAFNDAPIVDLWLPPVEDGQFWEAPWNDFAVLDTKKQETKAIQPAIEHFTFPETSGYTLKHTNNGWNKMTPDAMLFIRGVPESECSVAAIFEWVGQDETGFPSKEHKSKFLRDCKRLWIRRGRTAAVHGAITDLSRIVVVCFKGLSADGVPVVEKTAVLDTVGDTMSRFAFAPHETLAVSIKSWEIVNGGTTSRQTFRTAYARTALGKGLHGTVYSVVGSNSFIKESDTAHIEAAILKRLNNEDVPCVPQLSGVSGSSISSTSALEALPVGAPLLDLAGRVEVFLLGVQLVECLFKTHELKLCHRDVRPSNIVFVQENFENKAVLIDWASAVSIDKQPSQYIGTTHYASKKVLSLLAAGQVPTPTPSDDLESLVHTIYVVSRPSQSVPSVLGIPKNDYMGILEGWEKEMAQTTHWADAIAFARDANYTDLKDFFLKY